MIHLFNPENKFWNFIGKVCDACLMSILWALCSLPIITAGAATAAFYDFTMKQVHDEEGGIIKSFFSSFKANFRQATVVWLIELAGLAFLAFDIIAAWNLYLNTGIPGLVVLSIVACVSIAFLSSLLYVYPLLAVFDFPLGKILGNSFIMAVANLPVTITLLLITVLECVGIYYVSGLFFFIIGLGIFFSSYFITGVFGKYTGEAPTASQLREEKRAAKKRAKNFF